MRDLKFYHELEDEYEELLNEIHGDIEICGMSYCSGRVLREVDPIAFRCGVSDWADSEYVEIDSCDLDDDELEHYCMGSDRRTTLHERRG